MKIKFIIFLFLCLTVFGAMAQSSQEEKITITTYYPSPYGVYNQLVTRTLGVGDTNNDNQLDSGDAPNPNTNAGDVYISGNVGVGTNNPQAKVDIMGEIKIGTSSTPLTCNPNTSGTMRYNNGNIEYCNGSEWGSIGGTRTITGNNCVWRIVRKPYDHIQCSGGEFMAGMQYEDVNWENERDYHSAPEAGKILCCRFTTNENITNYPAPRKKYDSPSGFPPYPWNVTEFPVE